ncbi:MAG: trypsin-like serine protease [Pseudomonadota bacterium]
MKLKFACASLALFPAAAFAAPITTDLTFAEVGEHVAGNAQSTLATVGDPDGAISNDPIFNGVGSLFVGGGLCTATLVNSFQAITAAHCFGDGAGDGSLTNITTDNVVLGLGDVFIDGATAFFEDVINIAEVIINPLWLGPTGGVDVLPDGSLVQDVLGDGDIAIINLATEAVGFNTYDVLLEQTFDELFQPHIRVGRGSNSPLGDPSDVGSDLEIRVGANEYDLFLSNVLATDTVLPGSKLLYDCDSGAVADNFLPSFSTAGPGEVFGPGSLGLGDIEACATPGDSGGGNFIIDPFTGELILVGVTSFGSSPQQFGGFGGDTSTAAHGDWLAQNLFVTGGGPIQPVSAPAPLGLLVLGLLGIGAAARRRS